MGDAEHPPFVAAISLPRLTRFIVTNNSSYPSYGIRIRMYDDTVADTPASIVRDYVYPELPAHAALMDDEVWIPPDAAPQRHLTAVITTRTGVYYEELILRQAGNNQWMRAIRVMQGMRQLQSDIDSAWPRNGRGDVDWGR